jgi:CheY-like chemotaxis protein
MNPPRPPCVLVVDDEADIRETLREAIEMFGCRAILAADGSEALALLAKERPQLVLLDLLMPVMTGQELLTVMRRDAELCALRVVVSTSAPSQAPAGIPVLPKPIDLDRLWHCLRESCRCGARRMGPR